MTLLAWPIFTLVHGGCSNLDAVLVEADASSGGACPTSVPPEGAYRYTTGQGLPAVETIVLGDAPIYIEIGPDFDGTITHTPTGYKILMSLGDNHRSTLDLGRSAEGVTLLGWEEFVWGTTTQVKCGPPASTWNPCNKSPGAWSVGCAGSNTAVAGGFNVVGSHRLTGESSVLIGGVSVPAYNYADSRTIEGTQTGRQELEWFLRKEDGLLLRAIMSTQASSPNPLGGVATYSVHVDFRLTSLTPGPLPPP